LKEVRIGNKIIGDGHPCLISFETSATYSNKEEAMTMIKAASLAGADAIKFQTLFPGDAERILGKKDLEVEFTTPTGKKKELMYEAIKRRELSRDDWKELFQYSKELGLLFISSPYFLETVEFLSNIKIDAIKVSKGDVNNVFLIEKISKTKLPVILDGREKFEDVERAIKILEYNGNDKIIIMHCPSGYPTEHSGVHLRAIRTIKEKYDYPVGFADHSLGGIMNFAAIALGTNIIEKTITPNKTTELSEHFMSLEPNELKPFIENIRSVEQAMGNPDILKSSRISENVRRSLVTKNNIKKGQKITLENLDFQRPGNMGISCSEGYEVLNKKAITDIPKETFLKWDMLE